MKRTAAFLFFIFLSAVAAGCAPILIGGAAVAGAIVVAQDFATTSVDVPFHRAWRVANDELARLGEVEKSFRKLGEIRAKVENASIKVTVSKLTERTVDIKVTARRNLLPDTDLAQAILTSIIRNL